MAWRSAASLLALAVWASAEDSHEHYRKDAGSADTFVGSKPFPRIDTSGPEVESRIIGGDKVSAAVPFMASLQIRPSAFYEYGHICGAALIDSTHVLTAAHCIMNTDVGVQLVLSENFRVAVGGLQLLKAMADTGGFEFHFVKNVYCHPGYVEYSQDNDICILELATTSYKTPLALNVESEALSSNEVAQNEADGTLLTVYGWGVTVPGEDSTISNTLRSVQVPVYPLPACQKAFGEEYITENQICAGYAQGGKDACQGDSGGPALSLSGYMVGIVSLGKGCALPLIPGVYTRVSRYADFITEAVGGNMTSTPVAPVAPIPSSVTSTTIETSAPTASEKSSAAASSAPSGYAVSAWWAAAAALIISLNL